LSEEDVSEAYKSISSILDAKSIIRKERFAVIPVRRVDKMGEVNVRSSHNTDWNTLNISTSNFNLRPHNRLGKGEWRG
jgi:hypothetical protein